MNFMKIVNTMKISNYSLIFLSKDNTTKILLIINSLFKNWIGKFILISLKNINKELWFVFPCDVTLRRIHIAIKMIWKLLFNSFKYNTSIRTSVIQYCKTCKKKRVIHQRIDGLSCHNWKEVRSISWKNYYIFIIS